MSRNPLHAKLAVLLAVSLAVSSCTKQQPVQAKQESGPIQVKAAAVTSKEVRRIVQSVGTLFPFDESVISAEIDGRVTEVNADLGDRVTKGQVLVRISDEEQKYLVAQTEAQLRMAMERVGLRNENDRVTDITQATEVRRAQADLPGNRIQGRTRSSAVALQSSTGRLRSNDQWSSQSLAGHRTQQSLA